MEQRVCEQNVAVTMRDGVRLMADIHRYPGAKPMPALLVRTPYGKSQETGYMPEGYVIVIQDTRGSGESEGEYTILVCEGDDGYDTVEWVAAQPWCDGNVGMFGGSYCGIAQWQALSKKPPHLRAIAPSLAPSKYHGTLMTHGGAAEQGLLLAYSTGMAHSRVVEKKLACGVISQEEADEYTRAMGDINGMYAHRPLITQPQAARFCPWYVDMLGHPDDDAYWDALLNSGHFRDSGIAVMQIGGWFDQFLAGTALNYSEMLRYADLRKPHSNRLIIGPWSHGLVYTFPDADFSFDSEQAKAYLNGATTQFMDHWLKGGPEPQDPPVTVFVMGDNRWERFPQWPPPDNTEAVFYLAQDGGLRTDCAGISGASDYLHDPLAPLPTVGGAHMVQAPVGPADVTSFEMAHAPKLLTFTTERLDEPLRVMGEARVELFASTTANDTDWVVKVIDVYPDGEKAIYVADGVLRARYRAGTDRQVPVVPGEPALYVVNIRPTAYVFMEGHRIRIEISSSQYPRYDVNLGGGGITAYEDYGDAVTATNTVYHNGALASRVILPVNAG